MKRMLSWIVVGVFLLSCGIMMPSNGAGSKSISIVISSGATPLPTPAPISLSPISATNADQIQVIYSFHVSDTVRIEDLLAISPDKNWVALTPKDGSPLHVQRLKWTPVGSFVPMGNGFTSFYLYRTAALAFSPDSAHLAVANEADNSVLVFGLNDLPSEANKTLLPIGDRPEAVTFTKDSQNLIIGTPGGANGSLQFWDLGTSSLEREIPAQVPGAVCSAGISPDGKILAAGNCTEPFAISTWDLQGGYTALAQLARSDQAGACGADPCPGQRNVFAFNPESGEIASGLDFPVISVHDPRTGKLSTSVTTPPAGESSNSGEFISALAYTSDGAVLVMVANGELQLIDTKEGKLLWHPEESRPVTGVAISADSKLMVSLNAGGDIFFWGVPAK